MGPPVVFLLPVAALIGVLRVWPLEEAVRLSFTNWDGFSPARGVGFANYRELWHDEAFRQVLLNNLKILAALPLFVATPFLVAAALQSRIPGWSLYRAAFFFPTLISPAIIGLESMGVPSPGETAALCAIRRGTANDEDRSVDSSPCPGPRPTSATGSRSPLNRSRPPTRRSGQPFPRPVRSSRSRGSSGTTPRAAPMSSG